MNKKEAKEIESDKQIIQKALLDLFSEYNTNYGKIKKFKRKGNLIVEASTGGWSENEEAIRKFNETKLDPADISWWFLYEWKRGGYCKWRIPLFFIED